MILKRRSSHFADDCSGSDGIDAGIGPIRKDSSAGRWEVDPASDLVVLEERDDAFFADVGKTKDDAFVVINVHSKTTSEVSLLPAMFSSLSDERGTPGIGDDVAIEKDGTVLQEPQRKRECEKTLPDSSSSSSSPTLLRHRRRGVEYYVDHYGDAFYVVTNSPKWRGEENVEGDDGEAANGVGEYHLVRVRQPGNDGVLEGIDKAPWEPVCGCSNQGLRKLVDDLQGSPEAEPGSRLDIRVRMEDFAAGSERASGASGAQGLIQEMDLFRGKCLLYEACPRSGAPRLRIVSTDDPASPSVVVDPPSPGGSDEGATATDGVSMMRPGVNSWLEAPTARFSLSSPLAPEDVFDLCLESGRLELLRRTEVPGAPRFDGRDYRRVQSTAIVFPLVFHHENNRHT